MPGPHAPDEPPELECAMAELAHIEVETDALNDQLRDLNRRHVKLTARIERLQAVEAAK